MSKYDGSITDHVLARHMRELERMFAAEVDGALNKRPSLITSRAKVYQELVNMGMAEKATETVAIDRFGPITRTGYGLTHLGRMMYCSTCTDEPTSPTAGAKHE